MRVCQEWQTLLQVTGLRATDSDSVTNWHLWRNCTENSTAKETSNNCAKYSMKASEICLLHCPGGRGIESQTHSCSNTQILRCPKANTIYLCFPAFSFTHCTEKDNLKETYIKNQNCYGISFIPLFPEFQPQIPFFLGKFLSPPCFSGFFSSQGLFLFSSFHTHCLLLCYSHWSMEFPKS